MLKLVEISWYRRLNDQRVHINETFKGCHGMTLHRSKGINRRCASLIQKQFLYQTFHHSCQNDDFLF